MGNSVIAGVLLTFALCLNGEWSKAEACVDIGNQIPCEGVPDFEEQLLQP